MSQSHTRTAIALLLSAGTTQASLWIDFNSEQSGGGTPTAGDPTDLSTPVHHDSAYQSYHAVHEDGPGFVTAEYAVDFAFTGSTNVTLTPTWPNTSNTNVQQSIGRGDSNNAQYTNPGDFSVLLVRDWIGIDTRTANGGNGNFDGTNGTPTWIDLTLGGLPAGDYSWLSIHHDTENVFTNFNVYLDNGSGFNPVGSGYQADSSTGGNPDSGANRTDGPANTFTTGFSTDGSDVTLRFEPLSGELGNAVHNQLFAINGLQVTQIPEPSTTLLGLLGSFFLFRRRRP